MKHSIVYSIHPSTSSSLLVQIEEVFKDGDVLKWSGKTRKLFRDTLFQLSSKEDYEALNTLIKEQRSYIQKSARRESVDTMDFSKITIDHKRAIPILKELAATGKLYYERKQIFTNFFGPVKLLYQIEKSGDDRVAVKGIIKTRSKEYKLADCDLVAQGDPCWLIKDNSLQVFEEELSWRWIRKIPEEGVLMLSTQEGVDLLEELAEEKELGAPEFDCKQGVGHVPDPLPILALTDQSGAFANLLMNYGCDKHVSVESPVERWRNLDVELSWKNDLLEGGYRNKKVGNSHYYCSIDKVKESLQLFIELGWEVIDCNGNKVTAQGKIDLSLQSGKEAILVKGRVHYGDYEAKISDVIGAIKKNNNFIPLASGNVGFISKDAMVNMCSGLIDGEICAGGVKVRKHDLATLQELFDGGVALESEKGLISLRERLKKANVRPGLLPGDSFMGDLRGYQKEGIAWMSFLYECGLHGILADDMGLGKTVQVLAFLSTINVKEPILIVMPTSLLFNWKLEFDKFLPSLSIFIHHGGDRANQHEDLLNYDVILTSYPILRQDQNLFQRITFSCIMLDEAQAIKNSDTQVAMAVRKLSSQFRLSITGTPVENHLGELLSQFKFLMPDLLSDLTEDRGMTTIAGYDPNCLQRIKKKVKPFILRRKKTDVNEQLPEKIEQIVWLEMNSLQRRLYDDFLGKVKQGVLKKVNEEGLGKHRMEIFEAILRLRQICCHPLLAGSLFNEESDIQSTKLESLFTDLETIIEEGQKALVYSQFTSMLNVMTKECKERGWKYAYLDGSIKEREKVVRQFQEDSEIQLFLISLKAGGVGLNLTAADYVILYEPWWNEAVENQAIDRAHRIGRKGTVIAKRYVLKDSIEERMMLLKQSKRALANDLFDNNQSFDVTDLEFLLS